MVFCKAVYVKAQTGVNMINMSGNVNDKLRKRKLKQSKINKKMNYKPHDKQLINFICSVCTREIICLWVFHRGVAWTLGLCCWNLKRTIQDTIHSDEHRLFFNEGVISSLGKLTIRRRGNSSRKLVFLTNYFINFLIVKNTSFVDEFPRRIVNYLVNYFFTCFTDRFFQFS